MTVTRDLAVGHRALGQLEQSLDEHMEVYDYFMRKCGPGDRWVMGQAINVSANLGQLGRHDEGREIIRNHLPHINSLSPSDSLRFELPVAYANSGREKKYDLDTAREDLEIIEEADRWTNSFLGPAHPETVRLRSLLENNRKKVAVLEGLSPDARSILAIEDTLKELQVTVEAFRDEVREKIDRKESSRRRARKKSARRKK